MVDRWREWARNINVQQACVNLIAAIEQEIPGMKEEKKCIYSKATHALMHNGNE